MNDLPKHFDAAHKVANFPSIRPSVPERTRGQIRREASHGASKLDAGAQILTGTKANLGGRVDGGIREIVQNRPKIVQNHQKKCPESHGECPGG